MQKKIYVAGMDDQASADKAQNAVKAVAGVTSVTAFTEKCQVCVDFDESTAGIEDVINNAISSTGVIVLG